jgi:cysteinyl-tRNA synthetase
MESIRPHRLKISNTISRKKEIFEPIASPFVGMYVCGPTVYSDVHLGNCRTFISFDIIYRYLIHLGYKVRYVRNITDAGHLESDADEGEDKIAKKAKLEKLEPMEIVQRYTVDFHNVMRMFNTMAPSIEPTATGHIIEQQEIAKSIMEKGLAYEANGSIYFDVDKYSKQNDYGCLTGRKLEDLLNNTRDLEGQEEKRGKLDFALWIKAKPEHLQQWTSEWGKGFPGWHIECSAMSTKYLGEQFDIHGGGLDLAPTHHTNEIAQNIAYCGKQPARYWIHTNMLTFKGQKMSKSLGNSFLPHELFTGSHPLLSKGYSPMCVKFFMLQTHYSSTLDFSNEALQASEKGFQRLMEAVKNSASLIANGTDHPEIATLKDDCYKAMDDDFNTPVLIAHLFDAVRWVNSGLNQQEKLGKNDILILHEIFNFFVKDILGIEEEIISSENNETMSKVMQLLLDIRQQSKIKKDFETSDAIRNNLEKAGIQIKDGKDGATWSIQ